jgi:hypothetical protein
MSGACDFAAALDEFVGKCDDGPGTLGTQKVVGSSPIIRSS